MFNLSDIQISPVVIIVIVAFLILVFIVLLNAKSKSSNKNLKKKLHSQGYKPFAGVGVVSVFFPFSDAHLKRR